MKPLPKPEPYARTKARKARELAKQDAEQRAICRERSGGRCEVDGGRPSFVCRCYRAATQNHHLIGGIGVRNRGRSLLAAHRLDVCQICHDDITRHRLIPSVAAGLAECAATVRYRWRFRDE
jgi:hypothetical protein